MEHLFNFDLKKISSSSKKDESDRKKNLQLFLNEGLPNKRDENWKFSDLNSIIKNNFKKITNNDVFNFDKKIKPINDFEHNYILSVNGVLKSSELKYEEKSKIKVESLTSLKSSNENIRENLFNLNKALTIGGYNLEIKENYKCRKPIIIYNYFTSDLNNKIINNSNKIKLNQNSELTLIEYNIGEKSKFIKNTFEKVDIDKGSD